MIAVREIRAADGVPEQDVANQRELQRTAGEYDMAWRMARAMQHVEFPAADLHRIAFLQPAIGQHVAHADQPEMRCLLLDVLKQEPVTFVGTIHSRCS